MFETVDWTHRGEYMRTHHDITVAEANAALDDPERVVISPDYNSKSGKSHRIIGLSYIARDVLTIIVVVEDGIEYGINGWRANSRDRQIYKNGGTS